MTCCPMNSRRAPRRLRAALILAVFLGAAGCQTAGTPAIEFAAAPPTRTNDDATAFENWLQPRLDAIQSLLEAGRKGTELIATVVRARQPGSGVGPPPIEPMREAVSQATARAGRHLQGTSPFATGDAEQRALARDADDQVARMRSGLEALVGTLPRLDAVARALGPLQRDDSLALSQSLAGLLTVQVRADSVFADLVVGLLTPAAAPLPERELQIIRRRGNETLLQSLAQFENLMERGADASDARVAVERSIAAQRWALAAAEQKLNVLRDAGRGAKDAERAALDRIVRSYDEGLKVERSFLDALERFTPLVFAADRAATDAEPRLSATFDGARALMDRVIMRLQTNLMRLRTLSEISRGRAA